MKRWRKIVIGLACLIMIMIPSSFLLNHWRMTSFRRARQSTTPSNSFSERATSSSLHQPPVRQSDSAIETTDLITSRTQAHSRHASISGSNTPKPTGSVVLTLEQRVFLTYDVSRRKGWSRIATLADKYFMVGYVGLLKSVETCAWACGGSMPKSAYLEIGAESLRLGKREAAYYYLRSGLSGNDRIPNRDYFQNLLNIADMDRE